MRARTVDIIEAADGSSWLRVGSGLFGSERFDSAGAALRSITEEEAAKVAPDAVSVTTINWLPRTPIGRLAVEVLTAESKKKAAR